MPQNQRFQNKLDLLYFNGFILFFSVILSSCSTQAKFNEQDLVWMVYDVGDVCVFQSNMGVMDTIRCTDKRIFFPEWNIESAGGQTAVVNVQSTQPPYKNIDQGMIGMHKKPGGILYLTIAVKGRAFFEHSDSFKQIDSAITVGKHEYNDLIAISASPNQTIPKDKSKPESLLWSMSQGLVQFHCYNGETWVLISKKNSASGSSGTQ